MDEEIILGGMAILFAGMVVLVPVLGLTLRFAIKPFFDTWAEIQRGQLRRDQESVDARQLELIESELQQIQHTLRMVVSKACTGVPAGTQPDSTCSSATLR